jgi:Protein of unknown function (DUF3551)
MRISILVAFMLMTTAAMAPHPASAAYNYPWCATYYDSSRGIQSCAYTSFEQCMATVSGVGGICAANPSYPPPPSPSYVQRHRAKKSHVAGDH